MTDRDEFLIGCNELKIPNFDAKMEKVDLYVNLLKKWNNHFNLIGPKTVNEIYKRHILDSIQLVPLFNDGQRIIDFGTGAGLPAIILSIFLDCEVHAVDKVGKKYQFLNTARRELGIEGKFFPHNDKIENLSDELNGTFDVVTSRAFAEVSKIIELGERFLKPSGKYILLKGENVDKEIFNAELKINMTTEIKDSITYESGKILIIDRST